MNGIIPIRSQLFHHCSLIIIIQYANFLAVAFIVHHIVKIDVNLNNPNVSGQIGACLE